MSGIVIRSAVPQDLDAILKIERNNPTAAHWGSAQYERLCQAPEVSRVCLVAVSNKVVGFVIAREVAPEWELENIAVDGSGQGKGVGSALMETLFQHIYEARGTRLMLEVRESNLTARRLYTKVGMELMGRRKSYYADPPEDALLFEKKLAKVSMKIR